MEALEQKLLDSAAELKGLIAKRDEEIKNIGIELASTKQALEETRKNLLAAQTQLDAVDKKSQERHIADEKAKVVTIGSMVTTAEAYMDAHKAGFVSKKSINMAFQSSAFPMSTKTDITETNLGAGTSGVMMPVRLPGLVPMARQALRIRDVMNVVPQTIGNSFDYVYQDTRTNAASPQVEGSGKAQSYLKWASTSGTIRDIAHYVNVSKQALADIPWLRSEIDRELIYGLMVKEEDEILSGDNTGVHLYGIVNQATAFDTGYLSASAGYTYLDVLRYAKLQARLAGLATYAPNAFVLSPTDLAKIELTKDDMNNYIVGDPRTGLEVRVIWGLPVVESDSMATGTFLVGAFDTAANLIDRQQTTVDISFEHSTNFTSNLATVLCEERIGLAVKKATAFISGSFVASPATT